MSKMEKGMFEKLTEHIKTDHLNPQSNAELRELLRQIDSMVCRKRDDWQTQFDKLTTKLKEKETKIEKCTNELNKTKQELYNLQIKIDTNDDKSTIKILENEIKDLKQKIRNKDKEHKRSIFASTSSLNNISNGTKSSTISRLNRELLKEKENNHNYQIKNDDLDIKLKMNNLKINTQTKQNEDLTSRLKIAEKQSTTYQNQLKRANRMLADLERSSQALVSRLESELMRDKRLLQQQETLTKNLQTKLDTADQKCFKNEKELKVLKQRNETLVNNNFCKHCSNSTSGIQTMTNSGLSTPFLGSGQMTSLSTLDKDKQNKIQIERSKLIKYAKELRKRVQDREQKILTLQEDLENCNLKIKQLETDKKFLKNANSENVYRLETEIKSLTSSISRANSEAMHYKRDLDSLKLEITTIGNLINNKNDKLEVKSASGIECLDNLLKVIDDKFMIKSTVSSSEIGSNTDLSFENSTVPKLDLKIINKSNSTTPPESEEITPRMMLDITNTFSPKSSSTSTIQSQELEKLANNPSLTQDINEIIRHEELSNLNLGIEHKPTASGDYKTCDSKVFSNQNKNLKNKPKIVHENKSHDYSVLFDPNNTMSILDQLNENESTEIQKLDALLQSHIDNFMKETEVL